MIRKYPITWFPILFLLGFKPLFAAEEEEPLYQVEIIVFRHLDGAAFPEQLDRLEDYRHLLSPYYPDTGIEISAEIPPLQTVPTGAQPDNQPRFKAKKFNDLPWGLLLNDAIYLAEQRPESVALKAKTPLLQSIWEKLDASQTYLPLQYSGWTQYAGLFTEPVQVRIHNSQIITGPAEPQKPLLWLLNPELLVLDDTSAGDTIPSNQADPQQHYQLDGWSGLGEGQFLHLSLELEWRIPTGPPNKQVYFIYKLDQSRQVHTDHLEYFDTPWLGVIALVSKLSDPMSEESETSGPSQTAGTSQ